MTRFEERGASYQAEALTMDEAVHSFERSCAICCSLPGLRIDCDSCGIAFAHQLKTEILKNPIMVPIGCSHAG